jgi:hypothetical protein
VGADSWKAVQATYRQCSQSSLSPGVEGWFVSLLGKGTCPALSQLHVSFLQGPASGEGLLHCVTLPSLSSFLLLPAGWEAQQAGAGRGAAGRVEQRVHLLHTQGGPGGAGESNRGGGGLVLLAVHATASVHIIQPGTVDVWPQYCSTNTGCPQLPRCCAGSAPDLGYLHDHTARPACLVACRWER